MPSRIEITVWIVGSLDICYANCLPTIDGASLVLVKPDDDIGCVAALTAPDLSGLLHHVIVGEAKRPSDDPCRAAIG